MSYNTQEMSEIRVSSKIDRTSYRDTLLIYNTDVSYLPWSEMDYMAMLHLY